ncbi:MAG: hypothetical protein H6996_05885 [Moraxellaceae bacterium]|nr:hypothetical protein [Moraxellaceae bacterium]
MAALLLRSSMANGNISGQGSQMTWTKPELTNAEIKDFGWRLPTEKN